LKNGQSELRHKSILFAIFAIIFNTGGNTLLSHGMRQIGPTLSLSPIVYLKLLANPWIVGGSVLLGAWLLANLSLLSWADLSYVLPITAAGYALAAILGWALLRENVSAPHWAGIALITVGAILVGRTPPHTTP
jgi:uncharacterized membrane protein